MLRCCSDGSRILEAKVVGIDCSSFPTHVGRHLSVLVQPMSLLHKSCDRRNQTGNFFAADNLPVVAGRYFSDAVQLHFAAKNGGRYFSADDRLLLFEGRYFSVLVQQSLSEVRHFSAQSSAAVQK